AAARGASGRAARRAGAVEDGAAPARPAPLGAAGGALRVRGDPEAGGAVRPALFCAVAAVLIGAALQLSSGMYDERALLLVTDASALAVAAAVLGTLPGDSSAKVSPGAVPKIVLGAACAGSLAVHFHFNPTFYGDPRKLESFHWFAVVGLVLLSAYLCL